MVLSRKKKGQAAIEFLMTYGWMLLVVLIVGALIFSFVDFGSLLPNRLELSNNLRGMATDSYASVDINADGISDDPGAYVVFTYTGANRATIDADVANLVLVPTTGNDCTAARVVNSETGNEDIGGAPDSTDDVSFLNGQIGFVEFSCTNGDLFEGDTLEGDVTIPVLNLQTGLPVPASGTLRLLVNE